MGEDEGTSGRRVSDRKRKATLKIRSSAKKRQNGNQRNVTSPSGRQSNDSRESSDHGEGSEVENNDNIPRIQDNNRNDRLNCSMGGNNLPTTARGMTVQPNNSHSRETPPRAPVTINGVRLTDIVSTTRAMQQSQEAVRLPSQSSVANSAGGTIENGILNESKVVIAELRDDKKRLSMLVDNLMERIKQLEENVTHLKKQLIIRNLSLEMTKENAEKRAKSAKKTSPELLDAVVFCRTNYSRSVPEEFMRSIEENNKVNKSKALRICLLDMYSRMTNLSELVLTESNIAGFINGSAMQNGSITGISTEDKIHVSDWCITGYPLNISMDEEEDQEICRLSFFTNEELHEKVVYLKKNPVDQVMRCGFYDVSEETLLHYLYDHGYIYYRAVLSEEQDPGGVELLSKSEFKQIIKEYTPIQERLVLSVRSKAGTRRTQMKNGFLKQLGYFCEKQSERNDRRRGVASSSSSLEVCPHRLCKREVDGSLKTSWWRKAHYSEIRCIECDGTLQDEYDDGVVDKLFRSRAAWGAFKTMGKVSASSQIDSGVTTIARLDAWMSIVLMYFEEKQVSGARGGNFIRDMFVDYSNLKLQACIALLEEIRGIIRIGISLDEEETTCLEDECEVDYDDTEDKFLYSNSSSKFITYVPSLDGTKIFFYVRPEVFKKYVSSRMINVKDCVIGYATKNENKMKGLDLGCIDHSRRNREEEE